MIIEIMTSTFMLFLGENPPSQKFTESIYRKLSMNIYILFPFLLKPWESLLVGFLGALVVLLSFPLYDVLGIDDPVGAFAVHGILFLSPILLILLLLRTFFVLTSFIA